ncbi:MAG: TonB-dependent receptor [Tannerella sp.]|nr:TonB-dependent receptor [Tannerella sp.]
MKIFMLFTFLGIGASFANNSYSQETFFTIEINNRTIKDVFNEIEASSEYIFFYLDKSLDLNRKVSVKVKNQQINAVLDQVFDGTDNQYHISDRQIIISKENRTVAPSPAVQQQKDSRTITGTISDDLGPVAGANIVIKGTTMGVISDMEGHFILEKVPENATVIISYIGYITEEIVITNQTHLNVMLREDAIGVEEVVVVGYGIQKKVNLTGAVAAVSGDEIASKPSANALSSMQGVLPGVSVLRSSGRPGGEMDSETNGLQIRGMSSAGKANALVLIDGVEGDIALLNANDIESISVLKDAAAASIYGARAAAGVVLVTTKKGRSGERAKISYNGSFGVNIPSLMPERLSSWDEQKLINISRINASVNSVTGAATGNAELSAERSSWIGNPNYNYRPNGSRWDLFTSTNWMEEGLDNYGTQQDHSVSVSGGGEKTRYYISGGFFAKEGILKYGPDGNKRTNLRISLDTELNKYVSVDLLAIYQQNFVEQSSYGSNNILSLLYSNRGRQPIYQPEEDTKYNANPYNGDLQDNPIDLMKNSGFDKRYTDHYTGKIGVQFKNFVKGLTIDVNASRKASYYRQEIDRRRTAWAGRNGDGERRSVSPNYVSKTKDHAYQDKIEALLNYDYKITNHSFHVLLGASYEQYKKDQITARANNLLSNDFFSLNFYENSEAANSILSDLIQPWKMASLFGRLNYSFADRYLLEANFRYDGSSRLDPDQRWDIFPSFSAGWRVSEEAWFESMREYVGNFKVRASWGQLGNSSALDGYFPYLGLLTNKNNTTSTGTVINLLGNPAYWQATMASKDITWEIIESTNIGIDLGLLRNRLNLTADYYWKRNKNMMAEMQVGHIIGVGVPAQNIGELKTWGWEISANWNDKIGEVSYQVGFNISDSQNELVKYDGASVVKEGLVNRLEGYPLNSVWGYKTDGYWSSRQEYLDYKAANPGYESFNDNMVTGGDVKYVSQGKADHTIGAGNATPEDSGDLVYLGTTTPRYLYGINLGAQWRGFDFSVFFQGVGKRSFLIRTNTIAPFAESQLMPWTIHMDYWTENNQNAMFPRIINQNTYNYKPSDKWVQDGSYIRLKNLQVGYTIPISKKYIENLRVYIAGTDLWEHTDVLDVFDPEAGNDTQRAYYPFFRTWTTGVNITF